MCNEKNCLANILKTILCLQEGKDKGCDTFGCDKPYLGPTPNLSCYNTRPVNFYNCCTGSLWTFPYTLCKESGTSSVFRVENLEDNCCTCRVLAPNPDACSKEQFVATDTFFTINLDCILAIKCLKDTFVSCV